MSALPNYLQKDIQDFLASSVLKGLDLFQSLPSSVVGQIALKLKSKLCNVGHKLFESGDYGNELFIQRTGSSKLYYEGKLNNYRRLKRGDVCGENVILSRKRIHTLQAITWCEYYVLSISDILAVLKDNFDAITAQKEWDKMKMFLDVESRRSSKSQLSAVDSESTDTKYADAVPRHVDFRLFDGKHKTYVESAVCDDKSAVSNKSFIIDKNIEYNEEEMQLQREDEYFYHERKKKKKRRTSFRSLQTLFMRSDRQKSHSRDERIKRQYQMESNVGMKPLMIGFKSYGSLMNDDDDVECVTSNGDCNKYAADLSAEQKEND